MKFIDEIARAPDTARAGGAGPVPQSWPMQASQRVASQTARGGGHWFVFPGLALGNRALSTSPPLAQPSFEEREQDLRLVQRLASKAPEGAETVLYKDVVDGRRGLYGAKHPLYLYSLSHYARLLQEEGDPASAEAPAREAAATMRTVLGGAHPDTLTAEANLSQLWAELGKMGKAEALARDVVLEARHVLGDRSRETIDSISTLAHILATVGKLASSEPLMREAAGSLVEMLGPRHPDATLAVSNLAQLLLDQGKLEEAQPFLRGPLPPGLPPHALVAPQPKFEEPLQPIVFSSGEPRSAAADDLPPSAAPAHASLCRPAPARSQLSSGVRAPRRV